MINISLIQIRFVERRCKEDRKGNSTQQETEMERKKNKTICRSYENVNQ